MRITDERMWNEPTKEELEKVPRLYATEITPLEEKLIHLHFFLGGCDWYMAEYGRGDRLFFGYAILNSDFRNSEWGYISLDELIEIKVGPFEMDRDLHWRMRPAKEVDKIVKAEAERW